MRSAIQSAPVGLANNALRRKLLSVALSSPEFRSSLTEAASEIRAAATPNVTEATIEGQFERVVYALLREIGLRFNPEKEVSENVRRHTNRGRLFRLLFYTKDRPSCWIITMLIGR